MIPKVSGFTFVHNALNGGYPLLEAIMSVFDYVDEIVVVDCQSNDGTREWLNKQTAFRILDGVWDYRAGETLAQAHAMHCLCKHDIIIHFEADEVYDETLIKEIRWQIDQGHKNLSVYRLQIEQNFQRCRWYPELVHRVFPKGTVIKEGHTTDNHRNALSIPPSRGFLWDITNCFRDNWKGRVQQQARLWRERERYRWTPIHFIRTCDLTPVEVNEALKEPHWTWDTTPFNIPDILKPLVGRTKYSLNDR